MGDRVYRAAVVGLVALVAILSVLVFQAWSGSHAQAETAMNAPNMLAVTGRVATDTSVLYVIDTDKKQMAVYSAFGGRRVRFVGARKIKYDFELVEFNDETPQAFRVNALATKFREAQKKDEDKKDGDRRK
jgi:hypothetical protein